MSLKKKNLFWLDQNLQKQNIYVFDHRHKLYRKNYTFVFEVEGSFSDKQSSNHYLSTNILNLHSIIKLNIMWINTIPTSIIESNRYSRLNTSIFFISSSNQIISRNWGMMTNLLEINRASIYISLISFA